MISKNRLVVDAEVGIAGDMFSSALIGLGVPGSLMIEAMKEAARKLGEVKIELGERFLNSKRVVDLKISALRIGEHLEEVEAEEYLEEVLGKVKVASEYAGFARRTLGVLVEAEREAHKQAYTLKPIGFAHTPFKQDGEAPYQAVEGGAPAVEGEFYIELSPEFQEGLSGLESFSHIFVLSFLNRSHGYSLRVIPPWQRGEEIKEVGLFASRSPRRPNPIGLTLTPLKRVEGNRLYTGVLDLFDGTPIVDIKPQIRSIDRSQIGNDGWLKDTEHLELHKRGIPHVHDELKTGVVLHEAQDILIDIVGAAVGLEYLKVDMNSVIGLSPVAFGGGYVTFSHGKLPVPPPAVMSVLRNYKIPTISGPVDIELLTPTGASILAGLKPSWKGRDLFNRELNDDTIKGVTRIGYGMGQRKTPRPNLLKLMLMSS